MHIYFTFTLISILSFFVFGDDSGIPSICPVYVTLSPYSRTSQDSLVIINLGPDCRDPPDWVGLYRQNPSLSNEPPLAYTNTSDNINVEVKQYMTDVKLGHITLPWGWDTEDTQNEPPKRGRAICLNLFVASYKQNKLQVLDCLKIQPAWMSLEDYLVDIPFREMFIPGTHCSGCYMTKSNMKNSLLKQIGFSQSFNIWQQLVFGVRYLDFSIGYEKTGNATNNNRDFWIMNGSLKVMPLINVLKTIRKFVVYSHEPVFLDFYDFPMGFYNRPQRHKQLIKTLIHELGDVIYSKNAQNNYMNSYDLSLEMMKRRTVLIMYNQASMMKEFKEIWPSWRRYSTEYLKTGPEISEFMRNLFSKRSKDSPNGIGWTFVGVQGIGSAYNPDEKMKSASERAADINFRITPMLGGPWSWNVNVVAMDYFMSSNLIDIAIHTNQNKIINHKLNNNMTIVEI